MNYILIPLRSKEKVVYAKCSMEDAPKVCLHKWTCTRGYARTTLKNGDTMSMHRFVMKLAKGRTPEVDHINRDKLDNRRQNLRVATRAQNNQNAVREKGSNNFRGVYRRTENSWRAVIRANGKTYMKGGFKNEIDAARHYNKMAQEYHGKFAVLNAVDLDDLEPLEYKEDIGKQAINMFDN